MKLRFVKDYKYAFHGWDVHTYKANQEIETDSEALIESAVSSGNAVEVFPPQATVEPSIDTRVKSDIKPKKSRKTPVKC